MVREAAGDGRRSRAPVPTAPFLWLWQAGLLPRGRVSSWPQHMRTFHPGLECHSSPEPSTAPQLQSPLNISADQGPPRVTRPCRGGS